MESNEFVYNIHLDNLHLFPVKYSEYLLNTLRQDIYIFLISRKSEEDYFDVSKYSDDVLESLYTDLDNAKWKYALSYGNTGLFIFKDTKPKRCW